ncbi:ATP dependent DNA ligase C terminal region [Rhodospirillales bacterium URHD0017]|nr:ATP dependent DNA ligase C terminal region [Rhodospirillales bacterium URHD0017]
MIPPWLRQANSELGPDPAFTQPMLYFIQVQRLLNSRGQNHYGQPRKLRRGTNPTGSRSHIGALLLGYYTDDGRLHYAGRAGTGITDKELKRLAGVLALLHVPKMPLAEPPPSDSRFGSPLKLSRVHWVRPEVVVEVTYLTWTEDNLLRRVSYQGSERTNPPSRSCALFRTRLATEGIVWKVNRAVHF